MDRLMWGILLLPLAGFLINSLGMRLSNRAVSLVGPGSVLLAFLCAVGSFFWLQGQHSSARHSDLVFWNWTLVAGQSRFHLDFGLLLDPLSSTMTLVITGVGFLILLYSVGYMHGESGYRRFFAEMDLFIFTMLLLVLADNYLWLLVGWAGVGLTSYLLIGYYFERPSAVAAARKAFVMNVIGDWGIMVALFMMLILFGTMNFSGVFNQVHTVPFDGRIITVMGLLLLVGAVAKSAQIPLYTWLPDAMEGPTPVSALIHAATMVTAGVYLVARSYPIYQHAPKALHVVALIGAVGTVYAAGMGLTSNDIKRILAYSTMSQIAYMFVGVGVAVYSAGMLHLVEHAFFKALLFMGAGAVMHAMQDELDIRLMGGLKEKLPFTHLAFFVGVLSIIGTPLFSGFSSKEEVIGSAFERASHGDPILWLVWGLAVVTALLTAVYMFRVFFLVFYGAPRDQHLFDHAHEAGPYMRVPMMALMALSVLGFFLAIPGVYNEMEAWLSPVFHSGYPGMGGPAIEPQAFSWISLVITLLVTAIGVFMAWRIYYRREPTPERVGAAVPGLYRLLANRYYMDEIYDAVIVRPIVFTFRLTSRYFEADLVDAAVDGTGALTRVLSGRLRRVQTGYVRNYALSIMFGAVLLVGYFIVGGR